MATGQRASPEGSQESDCEKQAIVVNARDKQGKFVPSLQASDFRAKFGGKDVKVASLSHRVGTLRVVFLLDKSGSINSELKRKTEKFIGVELIRSLPETTQFALVAFGSRVLDALGRMVEKNASGTYSEIEYGPTGKVAVMNGTTQKQAYVPLPGGEILSPGPDTFWHTDWLGSVRLASSASQRTITFDRTFAPFGEVYNAVTGGTANPDFTGDTQDTVSGE